jgi:5'-deoxynucleotidase YfbR-like HD superfamily hydrolase
MTGSFSQKSGKKAQEPRAWQRMLSGRRLDLLDPSPLDIEIEDIALGLACVARWNGQTKGTHPFSVAEHSLLVERLVASLRPGIMAKWRLAALLHDAPEYVIGDMISPFKAAVGLDYRAFEERLTQAVHRRFSIPVVLPKSISQLIKRADLASAYFEAIQLAGFSEQEANRIFSKPRISDPALNKLRLRPVSAKDAQLKFIKKAENLMKAMDSGA